MIPPPRILKALLQWCLPADVRAVPSPRARVEAAPHLFEDLSALAQGGGPGFREPDVPPRLPASFGRRLAHPGLEEALLFHPSQRDVNRGMGRQSSGPALDFVHDRDAVRVIAQMNAGDQDELLEFA